MIWYIVVFSAFHLFLALFIKHKKAKCLAEISCITLSFVFCCSIASNPIIFALYPTIETNPQFQMFLFVSVTLGFIQFIYLVKKKIA